jgi:hypothetical protein
MLRLVFAVWCPCLVFITLVFHAPLSAQTRFGPFEITGYYQYMVAPATGHANPNNFASVLGPSKPGLLKRTGKPGLLLMRQLLDLNIYGKFNDNWSLTLQPRFFLDLTKSADNQFRQYESLPANFPGNGWMLRGGGNDFKAELAQVYVDYRGGNFWVRAGKQQIAWGEAIGARVLDMVNPLDLSQFFLFDRAFEEFDRIRVPQWFIRADYTMPNEWIDDLTTELIVNPGQVVPTIFAEQGAPFNVVPAFVKSAEDISPGEPTVGGRLLGRISGTEFSLNFITKPNDDGVGLVRGVSFGRCPPLCPLPLVLNVENKHPRVFIVGGSINYLWDRAGAILRAETTVTPDAPFQNGATADRIVERPVWKTFLSVERPIYLLPGEDSLNIGLQFFETFTGGKLTNVRAAGQKVDQAQHLLGFFLQQPLFRKRISIEFLGLFDTDDAHWLQGGVHWEMGNHIRLDCFYNEFGGAEKRPGRFGFFSWADGAFFRLTYGF